MDFEEKQKRQTIRVIIAEIFMVLAIVIIVVVSTLAAMGFMISSNGSIEQSGLLQLHTLPTGANVDIDGVAIFGRTNLSRTLSAGEHSLKVYRDGYDTWSKTINMRSGVLMRLYYPRLFLNNREVETVMDLSKNDDLAFYIPSPRRSYIIYAKKNTTEWQILDLRGDEVKMTTLDVSGALPGIVEKKDDKKISAVTGVHTYEFNGKIDEMIWSQNEENLLVKVSYDDKTEWILVRLRDIARSVNLTKTFGLSKDVKLSMIDDAANQLYVLEKRQLRRINAVDNVMSRILVDNVIEYMNDEMKVIYVAGDNENKKRAVGVFRDDEKEGTILAEVPDAANVKVALSNYYDDDYMIWVIDRRMNICYGRLPSYDESGANVEALKIMKDDFELAEVPDNLLVSLGGEYILAQHGTNYMVTDLDHGDTYQYNAPTSVVKWFDDSMLYMVSEQKITVWDFDGTNQRNLSENVKDKSEKPVLINNNSPVTMAANNRYIYYLVNLNNDTYLAREKIRD